MSLKDKSSINNNYILELKTFQATTFKQVVDALKEILVDVNFEFDKDGLKILAMITLCCFDICEDGC